MPFPQLETQSASKEYAAYFDLEDRLRNYRVSLRGSNVEIFPAKEAPSSDSKCVGKQRVGIGSRVFPNFLAVSWFFGLEESDASMTAEWGLTSFTE